MGDKIQEEIDEVIDTLSLTDFPTTTTHHQDHRNPPPPQSPPPAGEFFEFFRGDFSDEKIIMSHAEDIIVCGKLIPINEQRKNPPEKPHHHRRRRQPILCRRSESMSEVKTPPAATRPVRTSRSLDYKKLHRNSSMSSEPVPEIGRDFSGKKSSSSSRWYVLLFGLVKVPPPEMDLRDIKNRQVRRTNSKLAVDSGEVVPVNRSDDDHRKCSWRVLGFLSCKSSASAAVTTPLRYVPEV